MYAAALGSHMLLDWLNCDPSEQPGIQGLRPFSDRWFSSGWCVFPGEERRHIFAVAAMIRNLTVIAWELWILGPSWAARMNTTAPLRRLESTSCLRLDRAES
jgi:hypothetical protein